jgi:hypothetical protein
MGGVNDWFTSVPHSAVAGQPLFTVQGVPMGSAAEPSRAEDLARTMLQRIAGTMSPAEALRELRAAFPESPLTVRVAALAMLHARAGDPSGSYMPR